MGKIMYALKRQNGGVLMINKLYIFLINIKCNDSKVRYSCYGNLLYSRCPICI
jgi:hypothetical protein